MKKSLFFLLFLSHFLFAQTTIVNMDFSGLNQTNPSFLSQFIKSQIGTNFNIFSILEDVQTLKNLQLFESVDYRIKNLPTGKALTFICKEPFYVLPIVGLGSSMEDLWLRLGATERNAFGRGVKIGGFYKYFQRHSFEVFVDAPYLLSKRIGVMANISKTAAIEPAYFADGITQYNLDRLGAFLTLNFHFSLQARWEIGSGYLNEQYQKNTEDNPEITPGPDFESFDKYMFKTGYYWQDINYNLQYLSGIYNHIGLENVVTRGEEKVFWKIQNTFKIFTKPTRNSNFAGRLKAGISDNSESPFVPFVLDNYENIRGVGDRIARGTASVTLNLEYRYTILQTSQLSIISNIFADANALRSAGSSFSEMFSSESTTFYSGLGVRFYFPKIQHFILRFDYGKSWKDNHSGLVLGFGQYF